MFPSFRLPSLLKATVLGASLTLATLSQGAVSYLMIQADVDSATPGYERYFWRIEYTGSTITRGQDLLDAVFGTPVALTTPTPLPHLGSAVTHTAGNSTFGVEYTFSSSMGYMIQKFTLNGLPGEYTSEGWAQSWNYYNSGGGYTLGTPTPYADGSWVYGSTGTGGRILADIDGDGIPDEASFDAFFYEAWDVPITGIDPTVAGFTGNSLVPWTSGIAGVTVHQIIGVPEPSRGLLVLVACLGVVLRRRRQTA